MAKKKTRKKKKRTPSRKSRSIKTELKKVFLGMTILLALVLAAGFLTYYFILKPPSVKPIKQLTLPASREDIRSKLPSRSVHKPDQPLTFEIYTDDILVPPSPVPVAPLEEDLPRVAIIIDDMGYHKKMAEKFLELDTVLTFSILPYSPFQQWIADAAKENGMEVMLHLPMEPLEYPHVDPGPGTLLTSMEPDQLIDQLNSDLDIVPFIIGVNNHMGSKITASSTHMNQIFSILKKRDLFFVDSRTTSKSLCKPSARLLQVPYAQRDVFLDHIQEPDFIRKQIKQLVRVAVSRGYAIGIAHPHWVTYDILSEELPKLKQNVRLVPVSDLVHVVES